MQTTCPVPGERPRRIVSILGELRFSAQQAQSLSVPPRVKHSPYLEQCCLRMCAKAFSERLYSIYRRLERFTVRCYRLTPEAKALFADWYDQLDQLRVKETHQGLQAVYSKMQGYTGRLALILHCLNAAVDGYLPTETVSAQTMRAAIKLAQWFLGQVRLLYAEGETVDDAPEPVYTKLIQLSRVQGWLRAKDVRNFERSLRKARSEVIRSHFRELEAMGYGETCGVGNRLQWRATVDTVDRSEATVDTLSTAESTDTHEF